MGDVRSLGFILIGAILQLSLVGCGRIDYKLTTPSSIKITSTLTMDQTDISVPEGSVLVLGVILSRPMPTNTVVRTNLTGATNDVATAFDALPSTATIPAGSLSTVLTIRSKTSTTYWRTGRNYTLTLACDDSNVIVALDSVNIEIVDTKAPPTIRFAAASQSVGELAGSSQINASLNYASAESIAIAYSATDLTAVSGTNYSLPPGTLTIPAFSTMGAIPFTVLHDGIGGNVDFTASLGAITGSATLGAPDTTTVTIVDADNGTPADPVLSLSDATTGSTSYVRQDSASVSISGDATALKWCLSETQTTAPASGAANCNGGAGPSSGWYTSRPSSSALSAGGGTKTLYLWVANSASNVNAGTVSDSIVVDSTAPATPTLALSDSATGSTTHTNQSAAQVTISGDTDAVKWCLIEQASAAAAPTAPLYNDACFVSPKPTTLTLAATGIRKGYLYTLDAAGNVSAAAGSATIDYLTTAPANPTLSLADPTTSSTSYARQTTVDATIGNDATAVKWCLSATQVTKPATGTSTCNGGAGPGDGWLTARPTSTSIPSGDGSKTLTLWIADAYNNVSATAVAATITLDTAPPSVPTVALADPNTTSNSYTNQATADLSITADTGAAKWCAIEQANATAAPSAPDYDDACFVGTRPTAQALGATGLRKVYVYTQDGAGNVSTSAGTATITYQTTAPADPTLAITDPITGSSTYARQTSVDISIGSDATATRWCVSQTQTTKPTLGTSTCTGGGGGSSGWYTSRPTTFALSSVDGAKTVYVWIADAYNNVNTTAVTDAITLDATKPATPTVSITNNVTGSTSTSNQMNANLSITADTDAVAWCAILRSDVAAAPTAPLYDDTCWAGARPTTIDLAADGGRKVYVYTKDVADNVSASAGAATITKAAVSKLSVLGPLTIDTNECTKYRVVTADSSNWPTEVSSALSVTIAANNGATLYSDSGCSTTTSTVSLARANKVGVFYMKNTSAATATLSASATGPSTGALSVTSSAPITGVVSIAAGPDFTCFVKSDGTVKCSGRNWRARMLGDGTSTNSVVPVSVTGISNAVEIEATERIACVLLSDGTVKCWGANWSGQLGNGSWADSATPVAVSGLTGVVQIGVGRYHSCALKDDGTVWCWGANYNGFLGNGNYTDSNVPVQALGITNAVSLMVGRRTTCAVIDDGTVRCWGANGDGTFGDGTYTDSEVPVRIPSLSNVVSMAGSYNTCAVLSDETAKCWGPGWNGTIGDGTHNSSTTPLAVTGLTGVVRIASSFFYNCAVLRNGSSKCWGMNDFGNLGDGTTTWSASPVNVTEVSGVVDFLDGSENIWHQCARLTNGSAKCWGSIAYGEGGDGIDRDTISPTTVTGTSSVTAIAAGFWHTCSLSGGLVSCWGLGWDDILGSGTSAYSYTPLQVSGVSGASSVKIGVQHTCALVSGALKCWGTNNEGQLGDGTTNYHTAPPASPNTGGTVTQFDASEYNTCAVLSTGAVKCWGLNSEGTVGDGTNVQRNVPTQVSGLSTGVSEVALGSYHACAALSAGGVKCWGRNWAGHLGDTTANESRTPVSVSGISGTVTMLALGENHSCALISGGVKCWGANWNGQLGNGDWNNATTPVDVSGLTSGVTAIAAKGETTCALLSGGTVKCWGSNYSHQLGDATTNHSNQPVAVSGLTGVSSVAVGYENACAIVSGVVKCWGSNGRQQSGAKSWVTTPVTAIP